jgi:hypothetical protein
MRTRISRAPRQTRLVKSQIRTLPEIGEYKFWNYQASHSEKASEWIAQEIRANAFLVSI